MLNKLVYVQFNKSSLLLSKLKKEKNKFLLIKPKTIEFKNQELKDGILYNISSLYLHIKNFLKENRFKKPKVIISTLFPDSKNKPQKQLNVLQVALCASKSCLKIEKIIGISILKKDDKMPFLNFFYKKDLEKQLDFFNQFTTPPNTPPFKWLFFSGIASACLFATIFTIQKNKNLEFTTINTKKIKMQKSNKVLEKKVKKLHEIKKSNVLVKQKVEILKKMKNRHDNPKNVLLAISKNIPEDSYLTNLKINIPKNKKFKNFENLELEGIATKQQDVLKFIKTICQSCPSRNFKISNIEKLKNSDKKKFKSKASKKYFGFKISGQLKRTT